MLHLQKLFLELKATKKNMKFVEFFSVEICIVYLRYYGMIHLIVAVYLAGCCSDCMGAAG